MLRQVVAFVAAAGLAFVAAGVAWRYLLPHVVDRAPADDLAWRAVRDGVAVAVAAVGFGLVLSALGSLELFGNVADAGVSEGPLVTLATVLPMREAGGLLLVGGMGLLVASLLVPVVGTVDRRFLE